MLIRKIASIQPRAYADENGGDSSSEEFIVTRIHETAVVSHDAHLGVNVSIGPFAVIEPGVALDDDCQIAAHAVIKSGTSLGVNCEVAEGAVLGGRPQHLQAGNEVGRVEIGDHDVFREYVTGSI